jgi:hypothetical protein
VTYDVSVIVPTYNRAHLIGETLTSILDQEYAPVEIVVVDDGSTDETESVVGRFGSAVRYLRIENSGVTVARNHGVALSCGNWLAFCDSDDIWRPNHLAEHVALRCAAPAVDYAFSNFQIISGTTWQETTKFDQAPPGYWSKRRQPAGPLRWSYPESLYKDLICFQPVFPSTVVMSREFFNRIGGWLSTMSRQVCEDFEMALRCTSYPPTGVIERPTVGIRKHQSNHSGNVLAQLLGDCTILDYARQHHDLGRLFAEVINESIAVRRQYALSAAFADHSYDTVCDLYRHLPDSRKSSKDRIKYAISKLPPAIRNSISTFLLGIEPIYKRPNLHNT